MDLTSTKFVFDLPFPLYLGENCTIQFSYLGNNYTISTENIAVNNKNVDFIEDKYGFLNKSKVTMTIDHYVSNHSNFTSEEPDKNSTVNERIRIAVDAINHFIQHYRVVTNRYWINTISYKMIDSLNYSYRNEKNKHICEILYNGTLSFNKKPFIEESIIDALNESLQSNDIELWRGLYCDAKDFKLINRYREAILSINSAFENFLNINVRKRLCTKLNDEEIQDFMCGKITYDNFDLKKYLTKEEFDEAKSKRLIEDRDPPSTYKVLKKCNKICPFEGVSYDELEELASKIRANRNDIIHGKECPISEDIVNEAIISFEKLINIFGYKQ